MADGAAGAPQISIGLTNWADAEHSGWERLLDRGRAADRAGFDRVVVSDHVVLGENLEAYGRPELGGIDGGRQPTGPDGQWLEPLTVLAVLAGVTNTVRLGTNILLAALRRPVVLAKTAATLDVLSGGRLDLGVGVGWQREEYSAAGLEFAGRGHLLDHTLEVCQTLWRDAPAQYDSPDLSFENVYCSPRPVRPEGIPLWISGTANRRAARRLARFGMGWIPWGAAAADLPSGIAAMGELVAAEGGDLGEMQIVGSLRIARDEQRRIDLGRTMAPVPGLVEAGVTDFRALLGIPDEPAAALEMLTPLVAAFRDATS